MAADNYPLPRLDELVENAAGNRFYATIDLTNAYHQIELAEESRDITTFTDGVTLYRFKRLPFGLNCSPGIFSRQIAQVLTP
ncbi:reverse transcriptase family protein, partial [Escherichia coli]|uniref:reverse transcriptase family protein n=1 Tax=Escherichia coli TaxID=562 RepID=UPI003C6D62E6